MQQRQIMSTASPASLWRLRVAYLILKSSNAVLDAFQERAKLLMPVAGRRVAFSMAMAFFAAHIHILNLIAAAWFAQKAFKRLFKEVELASSTLTRCLLASWRMTKRLDDREAEYSRLCRD
jgi:hypothetical protein